MVSSGALLVAFVSGLLCAPRCELESQSAPAGMRHARPKRIIAFRFVCFIRVGCGEIGRPHSAASLRGKSLNAAMTDGRRASNQDERLLICARYYSALPSDTMHFRLKNLDNIMTDVSSPKGRYGKLADLYSADTKSISAEYSGMNSTPFTSRYSSAPASNTGRYFSGISSQYDAPRFML